MVQYQQTLPGWKNVQKPKNIITVMQDHIKEIHSKWDAIEDDIWAKIIVMERNRRVAKAYVRSPTITIGGGHEGFDGQRIGLQGFGNTLRDNDTERSLRKIKGEVAIRSC